MRMQPRQIVADERNASCEAPLFLVTPKTKQPGSSAHRDTDEPPGWRCTIVCLHDSWMTVAYGCDDSPDTPYVAHPRQRTAYVARHRHCLTSHWEGMEFLP